MKFEKDTGGFDRVADVAVKYVNTADKVVNLFNKTDSLSKKVGGMKSSTKAGLLIGGALALCLFPLRLSYDSETGEGEYKSLAVRVKRMQRPERTTKGKTHSLSWEAFPTVKVRPSEIDPCELPPAQKCAPIRAVPVQAKRVQKAKVAVPVKLIAREDEA